MERREFIKKGCFACMALGAGVISSSLSSCSSLPIIHSEIDRDRIFFDPLSFNSETVAILLRSKNTEYDILVIKITNESYRALLMQCTHNKYALSSNKSQIFCSSHGAEFDFEGNVTKGPAKDKLRTFPVAHEGGKLFVRVA